MDLIVLLVLIGSLAFISAFLFFSRLNRLQSQQMRKERFKARIGLKSDFGKKTAKNTLPWWSVLGRVIGPKSTKELESIQNQLIKAGFREERHLGGYFFLKFGFVLAVALFALAAWSWFSTQLEYAALVVIVSILLPERALIYLGQKRLDKINSALPDFLDMANICMNAGLSYLEAIKRVSQEIQNIHPEICYEFQFLLEQIKIGMPRQEALRQFAIRNQSRDINELIQVLIQNEKLGAPIGQAINEFSRRMYQVRENIMEEKAAKTSAKMAVVILPFLMVPYFILLLGEQIVMLARSF